MPGVTVRDVDVSRSSLHRARPQALPSRSLLLCTDGILRWLLWTPFERSIANISLNLQAQKFIIAYSEFLKRQGKLQIPGQTMPSPSFSDGLQRLELHNATKSKSLTFQNHRRCETDLFLKRLGRYRQDITLQRTPPSIPRLVLRPRRLHRPSRLPAQVRRRRPSAKSSWQHQEPRQQTLTPRQRLRVRRPKSTAGAREVGDS